MLRVSTIIAVSVAIASCDALNSNKAENRMPTLEAIEATAVLPTDEFGPLPASATGVAFWIHPSLAFNSLVIAATNEGIVAYNIETGAEIVHLNDIQAEGLGVAYQGVGEDAQGFAVTFDRSTNKPAIFAIDNETLAFTQQQVVFVSEISGDNFCVGSKAGVGSVVAFNGRSLSRQALNLTTVGVTAETSPSHNAADDPAVCAIDGDTGEVFTVSPSGAVYRFPNDQTAPFGITAPSEKKLSLSIIHNAPADGVESAAGQIAISNSETGDIHLLDREDGHSLGAFHFDATDEITASADVTSMGATGANLGGVYRNGAVAIGVNGETPTLRLAPVTGVANALSLTLGAPVNPRGIVVQEDNGLDFSVSPPGE